MKSLFLCQPPKVVGLPVFLRKAAKIPRSLSTPLPRQSTSLARMVSLSFQTPGTMKPHVAPPSQPVACQLVAFPKTTHRTCCRFGNPSHKPFHDSAIWKQLSVLRSALIKALAYVPNPPPTATLQRYFQLSKRTQRPSAGRRPSYNPHDPTLGEDGRVIHTSDPFLNPRFWIPPPSS